MPHRRAQDQQRARPGAARQADGQAADHRRDRRRPARRRHRDRVRAARPRVRRLHGHRGHAPPEAQRRSACGCSARPSCRVEAGARTLKEAVSAAIRDWVANVGDTHYIIGSCVGPAPYPGARARPAARHRRRGARAGARARRAAARARDRLRRRRLERDRHLRRRSSTTPRSSSSASRPRATGIETGRHGAPLTVGGRGGVLHGAYSRDHAGRGRPDPRGALDLGRPRLPRRRARARAGCATPAARATTRSPTRRRSTRSSGWRALEGIIPALESSHALAWVLADAAAARTLDLVCLSGRGDKDLAEVLARAGVSVAAGQDAIAAAFAAPTARAALMPYLMGGFPDLDALARDRRGLRRRRRRPRRARRAVLRPARRRPGDPRGRHAGAARRARRVHGVLEVGARARASASRSCSCATRTSCSRAAPSAFADDLARARHQRPDRARPPARGGRRRARGVRRGRRRAGPARRADDARRAARARSARRRAASSTRSR